MTAPPPPIRLDDLADPQFSPQAREMIDGAAQLAPMLPLEPEALMSGAIEQLGGELTDFGDGEFLEPLNVLCASMTGEAGLSGLGHVSVHTQFTGLLKNRLLLQDLLTRHPEIRDIPIERPIFIVGQPRTGTTHLHNLLAADPALRSMPYWESQQPLPIPAEVGIEPDPRIERCAMGLAFGDLLIPHLHRMHEMTVTHVHEEIQLLANSFSTMYFDTMAPMPSWRSWYRAHDQAPHYAHMKLWLQAMTFLRGGTRWVLKSPQHLEQLVALNTVFPDSVVLMTHRDPVTVTISLATMLSYLCRLQLEHVDPPAIAAYWTQVNGEMLDTCMATRELIPPERSMDIRFTDFMADDLGTIEKIYALAGQPLDASARFAHESYVAHHVRDRHGKVLYEFEPFGIDPGTLRARFAPYVDYFGLREEWTP